MGQIVCGVIGKMDACNHALVSLSLREHYLNSVYAGNLSRVTVVFPWLFDGFNSSFVVGV